MAMDKKALGRKIKDFRETANISQEEFGKRVFTNNIHISNIENGKKAPSLDLLVAIANALGVSADDLLVDSLTHSASSTDAEIQWILAECNKTELEILTETVRHLKMVLTSQGI